jgi:hypothetical protein
MHLFSEIVQTNHSLRAVAVIRLNTGAIGVRPSCPEHVIMENAYQLMV